MQGLADGYFVLPYTIGHYFASSPKTVVGTDHPEFQKAEKNAREQIERLLSIRGKRTVQSFHRELGSLLWNDCGMARTDASLRRVLAKAPAIREEFWKNVNVPGSGENLNQSLERAGRVADFLDFAELLAEDALHRTESCGGHFREESQTEEGEALRDDEKFCYVAAWEYQGAGKAPALHKEPLAFENVHLAQRSYK
jgi:succinate dehydrogenase / fumarate reductase flavoprotein subunit